MPGRPLWNFCCKGGVWVEGCSAPDPGAYRCVSRPAARVFSGALLSEAVFRKACGMGGILKIGSILHIDDRTAATNKKARVLFERLCERLETLAHGKRFAGSGADVDHVGEMLGR